MLTATPPRAAWSFGLPQDLPFTWSSPEAPSGFAPPPASAAPRALLPVEVTLLAPLPPVGLEALPPAEPVASPAPIAPAPPPPLPPQLILESPTAPPPELRLLEPPLLEPGAILPRPTDLAVDPPFALIAPPGPSPFMEDPVTLLDALWAARLPLPDVIPLGLIPPAPPPPPLAWPML